MTIREIQQKIADALNGVEALVQGGCRAFASPPRRIIGFMPSFEVVVRADNNGEVYEVFDIFPR